MLNLSLSNNHILLPMVFKISWFEETQNSLSENLLLLYEHWTDRLHPLTNSDSLFAMRIYLTDLCAIINDYLSYLIEIHLFSLFFFMSKFEVKCFEC